MYDELIAELRQHHCDAKEDDTQEVCEECAYDVIIADKSVPSGIASVCVCGLMHRAADAIEELSRDLDSMNEANIALYGALPKWIPVTEQLPEKKHCVLIFTKKGGTAEGEYDGDGWTQYRWSAKMGADVVTHWMSLPEPPEEE